MQFSKTAKLEAIVSADKYCGAITHVYLDVEQAENPRLIATDGHAMAVIPVQATVEEGGYIPVPALKAARKVKGKGDGILTLNGAASLPTGESWPREDASLRYPAWRQVLPGADRDGSVKICLNADLLHRLAEALGSDAITLELIPAQPLAPIRVTVAGSQNVGVIMPIRVK
jgi:hypothetical protein